MDGSVGGGVTAATDSATDAHREVERMLGG